MLQTLRMRNGSTLQHGSITLLDANVLVGAATGRHKYDTGFVDDIKSGLYSTPVAIADVTLDEANAVCKRPDVGGDSNSIWRDISSSNIPCYLIDTGLLDAWRQPTTVVLKELSRYETSINPAYRQLVQRMPLHNNNNKPRNSCGDRIVAYAALYLREKVAGSVSLLTWDSDFNVIAQDMKRLGICVNNTKDHIKGIGMKPEAFNGRPLCKERADSLSPKPEDLDRMTVTEALRASGITVTIKNKTS
ncbi:MAG: hypothetical protein HY362_03525 [Candidatus Aenigmarchaeota archaeon]|nr:hypothetical protein [Candidatus Aenigmarchaeota archaeon]